MYVVLIASGTTITPKQSLKTLDEYRESKAQKKDIED